MSPNHSPAGPVEGETSRPRVGSQARGVLAAVVVLLVPAVVVPVVSMYSGVSTERADDLPIWAVEAFGADLVIAWLIAARLPASILVLYGLIPTVVPTIAALIGVGTVGRWAALAGFCLIGAVMVSMLGLGLLLGLVASESHEIAVRLELAVGLTWPLLALEGGGCLLASSVAVSESAR